MLKFRLVKARLRVEVDKAERAYQLRSHLWTRQEDLEANARQLQLATC